MLYSVKRSELFNQCKAARTTADVETFTLVFIANVWGWYCEGTDVIVPQPYQYVAPTLVRNLANCVRLCNTSDELETIANGMRNCYLCGLDAR